MEWKTANLKYLSCIVTLMLCLALTAAVSAEIKTITSLPYTVYTDDNYDTLVLASSNMSAPGRAISFADDVHDVYLDLGQDTIRWNTNGAINTWGIEFLNSNTYNITVNGGYILHDPPASALDISEVHRARAVGIGGRVHDITIQNCYFDVYGRNSQIIYGGFGCYNIEIYNCVFNDQMTGFTQRDMWVDNAMLSLGNNNTTSGDGFEYHYKIHACSTVNAHWVNLYLQGEQMVAEVFDNYFMSDARNDVPNSGIIYGTAAQCYAVSIRGRDLGSRVKFYNNRIRSGTNYAGGRGIFISGIDGISLDPDSSIYIYNNDIVVHQGYDEEETTLNGILVRQGWKNIYIRDNRIVCIGDTDPSTSAYDHGPISGLRLTGYGEGLKIVGNTIQTYFVDDFTPNYNVSGTFAGVIIFDEFDMNQPDIIIDSNLFESNSLLIRWGFFNGHGGNVTMRNNTYSYYSGTGDYVFYLGYGAGGSHHAYNNQIVDGQFINGATSTNIFMDDGESDSLSIAIAKTVQVRVVDTLNTPRNGVQVSIVNNYGDTVANGFTDQTGIFKGKVTYWWESNDTFSEGDSLDFNNFNIIARSGSDTKVQDLYIDENSNFPTLIINGEQASDATPPDPIDDLSCVPGESIGEIDLTWTAVGDDGSFGFANFYEIRYSQNSINSNNWSSASVLPGPPSPAEPGNTQYKTASGLIPGTTYYFGIIAYDDVGNVSPISNISNTYATYDLGTGGGDTTGTGGGDTTGTGSTALDTIATIYSPPNNATTSNQQPYLTVQNIEQTGTNMYSFELASDASFSNMLYTSGPVEESFTGYTSWQVPDPLTIDNTYYWRVQVNSYPYSQTASFTIGAEELVGAFPNSARAGGGETIQFHLPSEPADLLIMTLSGETIVLKKNMTGVWEWDLKNASGNPVSVGVYLWYLSSGQEGKIVIVP